MKTINDIKILFEDEFVIVCRKPAGVSSQVERSFNVDMESFLKNHLASTGKKTTLHVIHRLDKPVSGILVYAKTAEAAATLSAEFAKHGTIVKKYYAIVFGSFDESFGSYTDYLQKSPTSNTSRVVEPSALDAKQSHLDYKVLKTDTFNGHLLSLVDITLDTGRHHQIRVQFSHHNHPVWGDIKYNPNFDRNDRKYGLALSAYSLTFIHPITKKEMTFEAIPENSIFKTFLG